MTYKLSPSSLNLMHECPRCFWLTQNNKWKRPSGIFPSLPSGMDKILKAHFDRFREQGKLPPELKGHEHCINLKLFSNKEILNVWQNNRRGIQWVDTKGNILAGAVDDIMEHCNKLIVLDFKTRGYACKENTADSYQNQLDIYNFLLRKNNYKTEDFAFLLFYIPKEVMETGEVIFDTELVKRNTDPRNGEVLFNQALELLNSSCPEKTCEWCNKV